jgi:hypothetical protein
MKLTRCGLFLAGAFLLASSVNSAVARADDAAANSAKQATVTIQAPQQVPGSVLERGTYIFKQTGAQSGWLIVQIYSNDGSALMTTVLAYPNPKLASNGQNFVTYPANGSGSIPAMEGIVFTGDSTVEQFAYPRTVADQIGEANHTRIPTTGTDDAYPSALPDAAASWSAPVTNVASQPTDSTAPAATVQTVAMTREQPLPATAMPLILLIGVFALVGIAMLRKAMARS